MGTNIRTSECVGVPYVSISSQVTQSMQGQANYSRIQAFMKTTSPSTPVLQPNGDLNPSRFLYVAPNTDGKVIKNADGTNATPRDENWFIWEYNPISPYTNDSWGSFISEFHSVAATPGSDLIGDGTFVAPLSFAFPGFRDVRSGQVFAAYPFFMSMQGNHDNGINLPSVYELPTPTFGVFHTIVLHVIWGRSDGTTARQGLVEVWIDGIKLKWSPDLNNAALLNGTNFMKLDNAAGDIARSVNTLRYSHNWNWAGGVPSSTPAVQYMIEFWQSAPYISGPPSRNIIGVNGFWKVRHTGVRVGRTVSEMLADVPVKPAGGDFNSVWIGPGHYPSSPPYVYDGSVMKATATSDGNCQVNDIAFRNTDQAIVPSDILGTPTNVPQNTVPPSITGNPVAGNSLIASTGSWSDSPTSYNYQWFRCDATTGTIVGSSVGIAPTYALSSADVGYKMKVRVTANNANGASNPVDSALTGIVLAAAVGTPLTRDTSGTVKFQSVGSKTQAVTLGASAKLLLVAVHDQYPTDVTALTYGGVAMSIVTGSDVNFQNAAGIKLYFLVNPPTGTNNLIATFNGSRTGDLSWYSVNGANVNTPLRTLVVKTDGGGGKGSPSLSVASVKGELVVSFMTTKHNAVTTPPTQVSTGQTQEGTDEGLQTGWYTRGVISDMPSDPNGTATVFNWTLNPNPIAGYSILGIAVEASVSSPTNLTLPTITGNPVEGSTLTAHGNDQTSWDGAPYSFALQWVRCDNTGANGVDIAGEIGQSYSLTAVDRGKTIRVRITATNGGGDTPATSNQTSVITAIPTGRTFGKTATPGGGSVTANGAVDYQVGTKYAISEPGHITKVSVYMAGAGTDQKFKATIFDTVAGVPNNLQGQESQEVTVLAAQSAGWVDFIFTTPVAVSTGTYLIAVMLGPTSNGVNLYYDTVTNAGYYMPDVYSNGSAATWGGVGSGQENREWFMYATYTPNSSGAVSMPMTMSMTATADVVSAPAPPPPPVISAVRPRVPRKTALPNIYKVIHYLHGGFALGEGQPNGLSFGIYLDKVGFCNYTLNMQHPLCRIGKTESYVTDYILSVDGVDIQGGIHTDVEYTNRQDVKELSVSGKDWKHYLERALWPIDPTDSLKYVYDVSGQDIALVVKDLLDTIGALPDSLVLTYTLTPTGQAINYKIDANDNGDLMTKIQDIGKIAPGFDFDILPDKDFQLYVPKKGGLSTLVFEENKNLVEVTNNDKGPTGTRLYGIASPSSGQITTVIDSTATSKYRRLDNATDFQNVADSAQLDVVAAAESDRQATPSIEFTARYMPAAGEDFWNEISLGDTAVCILNNEYHGQLERSLRLVSIEGEPDDTNVTQLSLSFDDGTLSL